MGLTLYTLTSLVAFLACAIFSPFVLLKGRKNRQTYLYSGLTLVAGIWCLFPFVTGQANNSIEAIRFARLIYFVALFVPPLFLHLTFSLLDLPKTKWERGLLMGSYVISTLFTLVLPTNSFIIGVVRFAPYFGVVPGQFYIAYVAFFGLTCAIGFIKLLQGYKQAIGIRKNQLRYIFVSWFLAYLAGILHFLPAFGLIEAFPHDLLLIAFVPISAYAIVKYRLLDIRVALTRTAIFATVYILILGLPLLVAWGRQPLLQRSLGQSWWLGLWLACSILATAAHYANLYLQKRASIQLQAEQRQYQHTLRQAAKGMTLVKDLQKLLNFIVHILTRTVKVQHASVWLLDQKSQQFVLQAMRGGNSVELGEAVEANHPLIWHLAKERRSIVQEELRLLLQDGRMEYLKPVVERMEQMGAAVLVPSLMKEKLIGFLVMSQKKSGKMYTSEDLEVFEVLAAQAAMAIENAQFYDELKRTQVDLFQTAKMASLGHMAGGMSHQVNNRFHVLSILAGTLRSALKDVDPTQAEPEKVKQLWAKSLEVLQKVEENALRGGDIVKTLLKFSRPSGEYKPVSLRKVLDTALEVVQFRVNLSILDLIQEIPEGLVPVRGDLNQLADCCFNLISNTFDATQKKAELITLNRLSPSPKDSNPYRGKISLKARTEHSDGQSWVVLEVQDNGIGMTRDELESLFIPFFTTKATAEKGTGLGLYIIQRIIEQHGGTIRASSEYGVGTAFHIRLPAAEAAIGV